MWDGGGELLGVVVEDLVLECPPANPVGSNQNQSLSPIEENVRSRQQENIK